MSNFAKAEKLLGDEDESKLKKVENLLGRSTFIKKPQSMIETQYLDLQKSKKFKAEVMINDSHKKNCRRNQFDPIKNESLLKYPTHKSLKNFCPRVFF